MKRHADPPVLDGVRPTGRLLMLCCRVSTPPATVAHALTGLLPDAERQRLARMQPAAQLRFLLARALLRSALGELLAVAPPAIVMAHTATGKPYLVDTPTVEFNISHSRDWFALALSHAGPVGVDVEYCQRRNNLIRIAARYFDPHETAALAALPDESARRERFFALWNLKEAYVKALGCGLAPALSSTRFDLEDGIARLITRGNARHAGPILGWQWSLGINDSAALVVLGDSGAPELYEALPAADPPFFCYKHWALPAARRVIAADVPA